MEANEAKDSNPKGDGRGTKLEGFPIRSDCRGTRWPSGQLDRGSIDSNESPRNRAKSINECIIHES